MRKDKNNPTQVKPLAWREMLLDSFKELSSWRSTKNSNQTSEEYRYLIVRYLRNLQLQLSAHDSILESDANFALHLEKLFQFYDNIYQAGAKKRKELGALLENEFYHLTYLTEENAVHGIQIYYDMCLKMAMVLTTDVIIGEEKPITVNDTVMCANLQQQVEFWRRLKFLWSKKWRQKQVETTN